jgi:hypothetical protein
MIVWVVFVKDYPGNPKTNNNPYLLVCETLALANEQVNSLGGYAIATDTQIPLMKPVSMPKPPCALIHLIKHKETERSLAQVEDENKVKEIVEDYSWNEEVLRWLNQ